MPTLKNESALKWPNDAPQGVRKVRTRTLKLVDRNK
jgi:hypothetical protein